MPHQRLLLLAMLALLICWPAAATADVAPEAASIVQATGIRAGVCVQLGVADGRLAAAPGKAGFLVQALDPSPAVVRRARLQLQAQQTYGPATIRQADFARLPLADNLANLVVCENVPPDLQLPEVVRILAPHGAVWLAGKVDPAALSAAGLVNVRVVGAGTVAVKPRPPGMDDWASTGHAPDGNPVSRDTVTAAPNRLRWRDSCDGEEFHGSLVTAGGRMFYRAPEPNFGHSVTRLKLVARDAYNGLVLWQRPVEIIGTNLNRFSKRDLVATENRVFVPLDHQGTLASLDAATGEIIRTYPETSRVEQVLYHEGKLFTADMALDAESGKVLWKQDALQLLAIAGGRGFGTLGNDRRSAELPELVGVDLATGAILWRTSLPHRVAISPLLFHYQDVLVVMQAKDIQQQTFAVYSPADGRLLWSPPDAFGLLTHGAFSGVDIYGAQKLIWAHMWSRAAGQKDRTSAWVAFDPASGKVDKRYVDGPAVVQSLGSDYHRCCRGRATEQFCLGGNARYFEFSTGQYAVTRYTRAACSVGMLPANGLVYSPPAGHCNCSSYWQGGFGAFGSGTPISEQAGQLIRGPAFDKPVAAPASGKDDWPTYRHDAARTGVSAAAIPEKLRLHWEARLGPGLTAPTIAEGVALIASMDENRVWALDPVTGKVRWSFTADGPIDSPPTIHAGLALFGCRDGYVYCLRAADGELVWRYQAAPAEEQVVVDGRLECAWPVHGSLLVVDDVAYFAAGWHSDLAGGLTLFALHLPDVRLLWKKPLGTADSPPTAAALLASDGKTIFMGPGKYTSFHAATGDVYRYPPEDSGSVVSFGRSSFLDDNWQRPSSKHKLTWFDKRLGARLLVSGDDITCGVMPQGFRANAVRIGVQEFTLAGKRSSELAASPDWTVQVPIQMQAMAMAGQAVVVAGRVDPRIPELAALAGNPRARYEIPRLVSRLPRAVLQPSQGRMALFSTSSGRQLAEVDLPSPPVFDGLAIANQKVFLTGADGVLRCYGN